MKQANIKKSFINEERLPLVISPENSGDANLNGLLEVLTNNHDVLLQDLLKSGAILFRGYNITEPTDFSQCVKACKLGEFMPYVGGTSPRSQLSEGVFTSTEAPSHAIIRLHNEMSYLETYPKHLYFCCSIAPEIRGATPLANSRKVYESLDRALRDRLEEKGVLYKRFLFENDWFQMQIAKRNRAFMPWQKIYGTQDRKIVEAKLQESHVDFEWLPNKKGLKTWIKLPAFRVHPLTGEKVWFNQINQFNDFDNVYYLAIFGAKWTWLLSHFLLPAESLPVTTSYGDGTPFSKNDIKEILKALDVNTIRFPWEQGDVLVIDNYLAMHGRESFEGKRRIMASLTI